MSAAKKKKLEAVLDNLFSSARKPAQPMEPMPAAVTGESSAQLVTIVPSVEAETPSAPPIPEALPAESAPPPAEAPLDLVPVGSALAPAAVTGESSAQLVTIVPSVEAETPSAPPAESALPPQPPAPVFPLIPIEIDLEPVELDIPSAPPAAEAQTATLPPQPPAPVLPLVPFENILAPAAVKESIPSSQTQPKPSAPQPTPPPKAAASVKKDQQLAVFSLAGELYGLDIAVVESIIKMQAITQLPHVPAYIKGVTNLRGSVLPVVDLRIRFNLEEKEDTRQTRIIIVTMGNIKVGVIVDGVSEVLQVSNELIEPLPQMVNSVNSAFLKGIVRLDDRLIILLELDKILDLNKQQAPDALAAQKA